MQNIVNLRRIANIIAEYYVANKEHDTGLFVLPRTNFSAFFGSATYIDVYEKKIPVGFMDKKPETNGVSMVRVKI